MYQYINMPAMHWNLKSNLEVRCDMHTQAHLESAIFWSHTTEPTGRSHSQKTTWYSRSPLWTTWVNKYLWKNEMLRLGQTTQNREQVLWHQKHRAQAFHNFLHPWEGAGQKRFPLFILCCFWRTVTFLHTVQQTKKTKYFYSSFSR